MLLTSAQSGLGQQCFLRVTFRSIALHGGHHCYNVPQILDSPLKNTGTQ
jgi:hypothetical protein